MIEWSIDWFINRFDDWSSDFLLLSTKLTQLFCFMTAVVTLLVNDPVTREQRNTTVAVLGKGSSFGVSQYFCYLRKCPVNTMDQARCFTVHACLSASISFNIVRVSFSVLRWHHIQSRLSIFSILQELALLHHKTRSATVRCKDEVSLLAVCREVCCMVVSNVSVSPP